jgi:hypothetical protein
MNHTVIAAIAASCQTVLSLANATELTTSAAPTDRVGVLVDNIAVSRDHQESSLVSQLRQDGFDVTRLSAGDVCDPAQLTASRFFLYIIPNCRTYPAAGLEALNTYIASGGHVLFLGGPFLDDPVWHGPNGWMNRQAVRAMKQAAKPSHRPFPEALLNTVGWQRQCSNPTIPSAWESVPEGPDGGVCFRYKTERLNGWNGYLSPDMHLYGPRHDLFTFMAKGSERTTQVAVEMQEEDGSRWIAVVDITPQWRRIALEPRDFKYWPDAGAGPQRGGSGDQLQPSQARRVNFQLAQSHTTTIRPGEQIFWIAQVGTCANPVAGMTLDSQTPEHSFETIYPRYKVYSLAAPMDVRFANANERHTRILAEAAGDLVCAVPRTMGRGYGRQQKWRFIPVADAVDDQGSVRGNPAWMLLHNEGSRTGSILACLGWNQLPPPSAQPVLQTVSQMARRICTGLFLRDGGAEHFAYWPGEKIQLGASITSCGVRSASAAVRIVVKHADGTELCQDSSSVSLDPRASAQWQSSLKLTTPQTPQTLFVSTELLVDNRMIDRIEHEILVLGRHDAHKEAFIRVEGNDFYLGNKKWYPVGVNYWPLYVSGMDRDDFWAGWIQRHYYEPELVEQDLRRMEALGINMVSVQANDPQHYRNLLDFIERCGRHGIYVNLFCGLASPLDFREEKLRRFIRTARLGGNPTVMAYDTIWEPGNYVFRHDWRSRWDRDWQAWVREQYGNAEAAEVDWEFQATRDKDGNLVAPPTHYFREDGPWRTMMAAYRRFMDDLMSSKWNRAHRQLRKIDPNHLISFRQGNTLPHDFTFTATGKHVDFISPEGYAIEHGDEGYWTAGFITRYVHFTTGGKPIVWAEFGRSVWDAQSMQPSARRAQEVADYHEMFYRMALESGANGTAPWWWPGGYRVGEQSDYGIVNPDGTGRPAAQLIARYGPQLKSKRSWPEPTTWFEFDRDAHAGGYWFACFNTGREAYREALESGGILGIRTAGSGTTSANTPQLAIGNRPLNGTNPPKFLNAEFNWLQILDASGNWVEANDGVTIRVSRGQAVRARICLGNTQEATWLAPVADEPARGDVYLAGTDQSQLRGQWPLPHDTPYQADADFGEIKLAPKATGLVTVELRMHVEGLCPFGEARRFTLQVDQ